MRKNIWIKTLSLLLCVVMLLPIVALLPITGNAIVADEDSSLSSTTSKETVYLDGVYYHIEKNVAYKGNSQYTLNIKLQTSLSETDSPLSRVFAKNGFFTVQTAGYYLLELWGGKGAAGENNGDANPGGSGGAAGYVYARVWLEAGQTLAYSIGTNGATSKVEGDGGGANGTGGESGVGRFAVGGGGGFSALYFFNEGDFNESWLTKDGWNMPESARLSNYVMIAAGGGGGGAGNGVLYDYATDANGLKKTANGGAGGNVNNGVSLNLEGEAYAVQGYVFSGRNGKSSGTTTAYVGRGGTNVPGEDVSTLLGFSGATTTPNDWSGSYNMDIAPGAGGTGNFRGGGGGAGYCGGSGGIMASAAIPQNVGGGGGGSSFIAQSLGDNKTLDFGDNLDATVKLHLKGAYGADDFSDVGGAFSYTYLGDGTDGSVADTSYLNSVQVQGKISKYFDVVSYFSSDGTTGNMGVPNQNGTMNYNAETGAFIINAANINASTLTAKGTALSLTFTLRPKAEFMGGNNVPLLDMVMATVQKEGEEAKEILASTQPRTDYVNVPLQFAVKTKSAMYSEEEVTLAAADLYTAEYPNFTQYQEKPSWGYEFINSVSAYSIRQGRYTGTGDITGTSIATTATLTISQTTHYTVYLTATPVTSAGYAEVGPAIKAAKTIWAIATVSLVGEDIFSDGWDYVLTANKTLSYDNGTYTFAQEMTQSVTVAYDASNFYTYTGTDTYSTDTFLAPVTGYYLVQAWGADGGNGGDARATAKKADHKNYNDSGWVKGGTGADGATLYGYIYLEQGDSLSFTMGKGSSDKGSVQSGVAVGGATGTAHIALGWGGGGGSYTAVSLTKSGATPTYLIIAGGGGGGGGAGAGVGDASWSSSGGKPLSLAQKRGTSADPMPEPTNVLLDNMSAYSGTAGGDGDLVIDKTWGTIDGTVAPAGTNGASYVNTDLLNNARNDDEAVYIARLADALVEKGGVKAHPGTINSAAQVTYICTPDTTELLKEFPGVEASGRFSKYFELESDEYGCAVDMLFEGETYDEKIVGTENGQTVVTYYKDGLMTGYFTYIISENADGTTSYQILNTFYHPTFEVAEDSTASEPKYVANCGFTLAFRLKPVEGFLGGNDVPVLYEDPNSEDSSVSVSKGDSVGYLSKNDASDYANVEVQYDLDSYFTVQDGYVLIDSSSYYATGTITTDELYTLTVDLTPPSEEEAWKYAFVKVQAPASETVTVTANKSGSTTKDLTASIVPVAAPQKAVVCGNTGGLSVTRTATLYVQHPVTYNLTNVTAEGPDVVLRNGELRVKLTAAEGYLLPTSVSVSSYSSYTSYDATTGELVISSGNITSPLTITAEGVKKGYDIRFIYEDETGTQQSFTERYEAGDTISYAQFDSITLPEKTGYVYLWEWGTDDGQQPETMPAYNVLVTGRYEKIRRQLTIHYVDSEGTLLCDSYVAQIAYGDAFSVASPAVEGYMASSAVQNGASVDPFIVSGTMGTEDVTVTVTYTFAENKLVILYLDKNGNELAPRYEATLNENASYEVISPAVDGYTARSGYDVVSGTLQGKESKTVTVYYDANQYRVDFEYRYEGNTYPGGLGFDTATLDGDAFTTVEFGNIYSYNSLTGEYGLPTPLMLGYVFEGWYTDTAFTTRVEEESVVALPVATVLYAKWSLAKYTVTIRYDFAFGEGDFAPQYGMLPEGTLLHDSGYYYYRVELPVGASYEFLLAEIEGYTPYFNYGLSSATVADRVSGTMAAMPVLYYVTYKINEYTVRFLDVAGQYVTVPEGFAFEIPAFEAEWAQITVTYGQVPVYSGTELGYIYDTAAGRTDEMYVQYSFLRTEWCSSLTGERYATGGALPAVTADVDFYACYEAHANVAVVEDYSGVVKGYFARVQDAINVALTVTGGSSRTAVVKLLQEVDLRQTEVDPTLRLYLTGSYLKIDLNGYMLLSDTTVLDNRMYLTVYDSVGTGGIRVEAAGGVTAIQTQSNSLTLGATVNSVLCPVRITVQADGGTAIGVKAANEGYSYVYLSNGSVLEVSNLNGAAYGLYSDYSNTSTSNFVIHVTGSVTVTANNGDARGAYATNGNILLNEGATIAVTVNGTVGDAYGCSTSSLRILKLNGTGISVSATSGKGAAYGIYVGKLNAVDNGDTQISATSTDGNATAVRGSGFDTNSAYPLHIVANAPKGNAVCIYHGAYGEYTIGSASYAYTLQANGKNAVAVQSVSGTPVIYANISASSTTGIAQGLYTYGNTAKLQSGISISALTDSGKAYALYSTVFSFADAIDVITITASSLTGTAVALYDARTTGTISNKIAIAATTASGDAYGLWVTGDYNYSGITFTVTATEAGATAYGAFVDGKVSLTSTVFSANGYNACGIRLGAGAALTMSAPTLQVTATGADGVAYGLYLVSGGKLTSATGNVTVASEQGEATGVYNKGTVSSIGIVCNVTANANAYGFVGAGGTLTQTSNGFTLSVISAAQNAYGLYADGGDVGAAGIDSSVRYGKITVAADNGTAYAFYGADGTVYVRGQQLFYKGSSAVDVQGVVICEGYVEHQYDESNATYPGYYYLSAQTYTITFVERDISGTVILKTNSPVSYTPEYTVIYEPTHSAPLDPGYAVTWEPYDFSAPIPGVNQDPDNPNNKFVYSLYTKKQFNITVYFNDDTNHSEVFTYTYLDPTEAPDMSGYLKAGHTFTGEWYTDAAFTDGTQYYFGTMGNADVTVYGRWEAVEIEVYFVTNGGSEITPNPVRGKYNQSYPIANPTRPGYSFDGWYSNEALTEYYADSFTTIPAQSMTLYAKWIASVSMVVLGEPKGYTVHLNIAFSPEEEATEVIELQFNEGELTAIPLHEMYLSSSANAGELADVPVFLRSWKTADGKSVNLGSGIGSWGVEPDENGVINLYPDLTTFADASQAYDILAQAYGSSEDGSLAGLGGEVDGVRFDFAGMAALMAGEQGAATNKYAYLTYRALCDGVHQIAISSIVGSSAAEYAVMDADGNITEWQVIALPEEGSGSLSLEDMKLEHFAIFDVEMEKGEVLLIRSYINIEIPEGTDSTQLADVLVMGAQLPVDDSVRPLIDAFVMMHNAMDFLFYNSGAGSVKLPTDPDKGFEGINGWKYVQNGVLSEETLRYFNHAMLEKDGAWFTHPDTGIPMIILYPTEEMGKTDLTGWIGAITPGRHFDINSYTDIVGNAAISANGSASFVLMWMEALASSNPEQMYALAGQGTLSFANGLPAGTTLSLVDYSDAIVNGYPAYYYYNVSEENAGIKQIALCDFVMLGEAPDSENRFSGFSPLIAVSVSYAPSTHTLTEETISLDTDGGRADTAFTVSLQHTREVDMGSLSAQPNTPLSGQIPIYPLADRGYGTEDIVLAKMWLEDENGTFVPVPANMNPGGDAVVLGGMIGLPIGTVGMINDVFEQTGKEMLAYPVSLNFDALRYHGFKGRMHLEILVIPAYVLDYQDHLSYLGVDTFLDTHYVADFTLNNLPQISIFNAQDGKKETAKAGDELLLSTTVGELSEPVEIKLYVYQRVGTQMQHTAACDALLKDYDNVADGLTFNSGELTLELADGDVAAGVYFLVAYYGDNYAVYTLTVTP